MATKSSSSSSSSAVNAILKTAAASSSGGATVTSASKASTVTTGGQYLANAIKSSGGSSDSGSSSSASNPLTTKYNTWVAQVAKDGVVSSNKSSRSDSSYKDEALSNTSSNIGIENKRGVFDTDERHSYLRDALSARTDFSGLITDKDRADAATKEYEQAQKDYDAAKAELDKRTQEAGYDTNGALPTNYVDEAKKAESDAWTKLQSAKQRMNSNQYLAIINDPTYGNHILAGNQNYDASADALHGEDPGNKVRWANEHLSEIVQANASPTHKVDGADKWYSYTFMTANERGVYATILATQGSEKADEFLEWMLPTLTARAGQNLANGVEQDVGVSKVLNEINLALKAGGNSTVAGIAQNFKSDAIPYTVAETARMYDRDSLNPLMKGVTGVAESLTSTLPSLLGAGVPGAGHIIEGIQTRGSLYRQLLNEGYSPEQANETATVVGVATGLTSYFLSGISAIGGKVSKAAGEKLAPALTQKVESAAAKATQTAIAKYGVDEVSEISEEILQNKIEDIARNMFLGEDNDLSLNEDDLETAFITAITTALFNAPNAAIDIANGKLSTASPIDVKTAEGTATETNLNKENGFTAPESNPQTANNYSGIGEDAKASKEFEKRLNENEEAPAAEEKTQENPLTKNATKKATEESLSQSGKNTNQETENATAMVKPGISDDTNRTGKSVADQAAEELIKIGGKPGQFMTDRDMYDVWRYMVAEADKEGLSAETVAQVAKEILDNGWDISPTEAVNMLRAKAGLAPISSAFAAHPEASLNGNDIDSKINELVDEFGSKEPNKMGQNKGPVPERVEKGTRVGDAAESVMSAKVTPESRIPTIKEAILDGKFNHVVVPNDVRAQKAQADVKADYKAARAKFHDAVVKGQNTADNVALGAMLINEAGNNSEMSGAEYIDLVMEFEELSHGTGAALQANQILQKLTPEGKIYSASKTTSKINESGKKPKTKTKAKIDTATAAVTEAITTAKETAVNEVAEGIANTVEKTDSKAKSKSTGNALSNSANKHSKSKPKEKLKTDPKDKNRVFTFEYADEAAKTIAKAVESKVESALKPKKVTTAMDMLVNSIKKFAMEKMPKADKTKPLTAKDVLADMAQNESFAQEAYEKAQLEVHDYLENAVASAKSPEEASAIENAAGQFSDEGLNIPKSTIVQKAVAQAAVDTDETKDTIRKQAALGMSVEEISKQISGSLIADVGAKGELAYSIEQATYDYVNSIIAEDAKTPEERVNTLVNGAMHELGETFRQLAVQDSYTKAQAEETLVNLLTQKYGVDEESAKHIAESITSDFSTKLQKAMDAEIEKRYGPKNPKSKAVKSLSQQFTEAINLGAFTSQYASTAVEKVFGFSSVQLNPQFVEDFLHAKTDEERNDVMDKIQQDLANQIRATPMEKFNALRYLNMLGNLKTQGRNVLGNIGMSITTKAKNGVKELLETIAVKVSGGKYTKEYTNFYGSKLGKAARNDFKANKDVQKAAMGESKYSDYKRQFAADVNDKRHIFKFDNNALTRGLHLANKPTLLELYRMGTNALMDWGDRIFVSMNYADSLAGYLKTHKITAEQWAEMSKDSSNETVQAARNYAIQQAQIATFRDTNAISGAAQYIGHMSNLIPDGAKGKNVVKGADVLFQGVSPFTKTPANVGKAMVEYSPLGFFVSAGESIAKAVGDENVTGNMIIDSVSKAVTGTGLAALGFVLQSIGRARTKDDDDKQEAFDKTSGKQDFSITIPINGKEISFTMDWCTPAAGAFFTGVALGEILDGTKPANGDEILSMFAMFSSSMLEMSMLSGMNDALENISQFGGDSSALGEFTLNSILSYLTQGLTNSLVGQVSQGLQDERMTYYTEKNSWVPTVIQKWLSKTSMKFPGDGFQTASYINAWGEKVKYADQAAHFFASIFSPSYVSVEDDSEITETLNEIYDALKDTDFEGNVFPQTPSRSTIIDDKELTPDEYDTYATVVGQMKHDLVTRLFASEDFDSLTDLQKGEILTDLYSYANAYGKNLIQKQRGSDIDNDYASLTDKIGAKPFTNQELTEYVTIKDLFNDGNKDNNASTIDFAVDMYNNTTGSARKLLEDNYTLQKYVGASELGINAQTVMDIDDAKKQVVADTGLTANNTKTALLGIARTNLSEDEKRQIIESGYLNLSKTGQAVYDAFSKYDSFTVSDIANWLYNADYTAYNGVEYGNAGTLSNLEAAAALMKIPSNVLTDDEKSEIYEILKEGCSNANNDWKNYSYASEVRYLNSHQNTGYTNGRPEKVEQTEGDKFKETAKSSDETAKEVLSKINGTEEEEEKEEEEEEPTETPSGGRRGGGGGGYKTSTTEQTPWTANALWSSKRKKRGSSNYLTAAVNNLKKRT